jgi:hypothetical protein
LHKGVTVIGFYRYVPPNVASKWKKDSRAMTDESDPKKWIDLVHPDEFPLGNFHANLQKKMAACEDWSP